MQTPGFCVVYRWVVREGMERQCREAWARLTEAIRRDRGGLGSRLHLADDGTWVAYAQWPDRETWAAAQLQDPPDAEAARQMDEAIEARLAPIVMEPQLDLLGEEPARARVYLREERDDDAEAVRALYLAAFEGPGEAVLVDRLRAQADPRVALVAEAAGRVVGHVLFTPVAVDGCGKRLMGLAPMAVRPGLQRRGVGSLLVRGGLERCAQLGAEAVVVLGHPDYYPRFGFRPAADFGIDCEYDVPPEVFQALELHDGALDDVAGTVRYHGAFAELPS